MASLEYASDFLMEFIGLMFMSVTKTGNIEEQKKFET